MSETLEGEVVESTALALHEEALTRPLVSPEEAKAAVEEYYRICEAVLSPDDYQEFTQKKKTQVNGKWQWIQEKKKFKKKSAVKKLQTFWGIAVAVKDVQRDDLGDGNYAFRVTATATNKAGRAVDSTGACSTLEERFDLSQYNDESDAAFATRHRKALARAYHDILSTAETRATNRAVMNAIGVGGGEVTADEVQRERVNQEPCREQKPAQEPPKPKAEPSVAPLKVEVAGTPITIKARADLNALVSGQHLTPLEIQEVVGECLRDGRHHFDQLETLEEARMVYKALLDAKERATTEIPM